ncbi:MAG TPA: hypothetical protein VK933_13585 [Longimicrobiales bacterium]|nr:hypothetical protein [Longimicrobiales bacterium]
MRRLLTCTFALVLMLLAAGTASAQGHEGHSMGAGHDSATMAHMQMLHQLVMNHERIAHTVTNLPDGVRVVLESDDTAVARLIHDHAAAMETLLDGDTDAGAAMHSEAVRTILSDRASIEGTIEHTDRGVTVVQKSKNPATAAALQQHAAELSSLLADGMEAMHEMMMKGDSSHAGHGAKAGEANHAAHAAQAGAADHSAHAAQANPSAHAAHAAQAAPAAQPAQADHSAHAAHAAAANDTAFAALQARGLKAMGVDQYTSTHRFDALDDGGRIELQRDVDDAAGVTQIREHLQGIAAAFKSGDFSTPAFVHMQQVPGADVMAARRNVITYTFSELPRGGELRITTRDPAALEAIHAFLSFQRSDHRTAH